ncbi:MAG: hypothetical protein WAL59_15320 [Roseiarcus sp.]
MTRELWRSTEGGGRRGKPRSARLRAPRTELCAANGALRLAERYFVAALTSLKTVLI